MRRVGLEVVGHLVRRRVRRALRREPKPGKPVVARRRVEPERVPALPPGIADALARVEDHERPAVLLQVVSSREPGLPAADDHGVEAFGCHLGLLVVSLQTVGGRAAGAHRADPPTSTCRDMVISDHARRQTRSCSNANAVAAARDERPSFAKMFWTCRATVCSLMTSEAAISRFVLPAATSRRTSSSRRESPCSPFADASNRARSGASRRDARRCPSPRRAPAWPPRRHQADGTRLPRGRACARSRTARRARAMSRPPSAGRRAPRAARPRRGVPRLARARPSLPASRSRTRSRSARARRRRDEPRRTVPAVSAISTKAGRSRARSSGAVAADSARLIAATAASARPCASRSWARPGCGSHPNALAFLYACSAPAEVALQAQELALPVAGKPGCAIPRLDEALAGATWPPRARRATSRRAA